MAITIIRTSTSAAATPSNSGKNTPTTHLVDKPKKRATHTKARPIDHIAFDQPGILRVGHLMTAFSLSHSGLYQGMKVGQIPQPDGYYGGQADPDLPNKKTRRTPYWHTSTIRPLLGVK
jgi:hypothetical protein